VIIDCCSLALGPWFMGQNEEKRALCFKNKRKHYELNAVRELQESIFFNDFTYLWRMKK
jgi:hypothetical protein